jgi:hypothetical protein
MEEGPEVDGHWFDKFATAFSGWLSRRQLLKGMAAGGAGGLLRLPARQGVEESIEVIVEWSKRALEALEGIDASQFDGHPDQDNIVLFVDYLRDLATVGAVDAQSWTDQAQVDGFVRDINGIVLSMRFGTDAYLDDWVAQGDQRDPDNPPERPRTCVYEELDGWQECAAPCAAGDATCLVPCFWNFIILDTCLRCAIMS